MSMLMPAANALRRALYPLAIAAALELDDYQRTELRRLVEATVDELKSTAQSPERMVIQLRQLAQEAGFRLELAVADVESTIVAREHLLTQVVRWSLEHYFSGAHHVG